MWSMNNRDIDRGSSEIVKHSCVWKLSNILEFEFVWELISFDRTSEIWRHISRSKSEMSGHTFTNSHKCFQLSYKRMFHNHRASAINMHPQWRVGEYVGNIYIYMYICLYKYAYLCVWINTYIYACMCIYIHMYIDTFVPGLLRKWRWG